MILVLRLLKYLARHSLCYCVSNSCCCSPSRYRCIGKLSKESWVRYTATFRWRSHHPWETCGGWSQSQDINIPSNWRSRTEQTSKRAVYYNQRRNISVSHKERWYEEGLEYQSTHQCFVSLSAWAMYWLILSILVSCWQYDLMPDIDRKVTYKSSSSLFDHRQIKRPSQPEESKRREDAAHLEPAFIGTASFTFSTSDCPELCAAGSFLPPDLRAQPMPPTLKTVPRVRYSFLMARPNMMLQSSKCALDRRYSISVRTVHILWHGKGSRDAKWIWVRNFRKHPWIKVRLHEFCT